MRLFGFARCPGVRCHSGVLVMSFATTVDWLLMALLISWPGGLAGWRLFFSLRLFLAAPHCDLVTRCFFLCGALYGLTAMKCKCPVQRSPEGSLIPDIFIWVCALSDIMLRADLAKRFSFAIRTACASLVRLGYLFRPPFAAASSATQTNHST